MCFGGGGGGNQSGPAPVLPPPAKPILPTAAPQAPPTITQAPNPIQQKNEEPTLKTKRSKRDEQGALSRGTSQLRIPLNTGSGGGGGLNL